MQIYGNDHTIMDAIVSEINATNYRVRFIETNIEHVLPKIYVHTHIQEPKRQKLEIETWYLKKNRIIPLDAN